MRARLLRVRRCVLRGGDLARAARALPRAAASARRPASSRSGAAARWRAAPGARAAGCGACGEMSRPVRSSLQIASVQRVVELGQVQRLTCGSSTLTSLSRIRCATRVAHQLVQHLALRVEHLRRSASSRRRASDRPMSKMSLRSSQSTCTRRMNSGLKRKLSAENRPSASDLQRLALPARRRPA